MAPTVKDNDAYDPRLEVYLFVEDMVKYVFDFLHFENPPRVGYGPAGFADNIIRAVLKLVRAPHRPCLQDKMREVITSCLSLSCPAFDQLASKIAPLMQQYEQPLDITYPEGYFQLFRVSCKLCLMFQRAQREDCVSVTKDVLKTILHERTTNYRIFRVLDSHAEAILAECGDTRR